MLILLAFISSLTSACPTVNPEKINTIIEYQYKVIARYPHNPNVFTQGLEFYRGELFESAGRRGHSKVLKRTLTSSKPIHQHRLAKQFFAEGITLLNDQLFQLTWQSKRGFIYNPNTLQLTGDFTIKGEGWGMTNNGKQLIISNGSHQLTFIDPKDFSVRNIVDVTFDNKPLNNINELEWVDGLIYANIWQSDLIVMIDPKTGKVVGKVLLSNLLPVHLKTVTTNVLNGIAYDRRNKRLLVTGKNWPLLFHIELTTGT